MNRPTDRFLKLACSLAFAFSLAPSDRLHAAAAAFDEVTDSAYSDGWQNGDNSADIGHFGFGAWVFDEVGTTALGVADLTANGGAATGQAWSVNADADLGSSVASATRSFTAGNANILNPSQSILGVDEQFSATLDFGDPTPFSGLSLGFVLQNASGTDRLRIEANFLEGDFKLTVGSTTVPTGVLLTSEPILFTFTPKAGLGFTATLGSATFDENSGAGALDANDISRVRLQNLSGGTEIMATQMSVTAVPEPSGGALLLLGLCGLAARRRVA